MTSKCAEDEDFSFLCKDPTKWVGTTIPDNTPLGPNTDKNTCDELSLLAYAGGIPGIDLDKSK